MPEHPLQGFMSTWSVPWDNVFREQYEKIARYAESLSGFKLGTATEVRVGLHGNAHAFRCVVGLRLRSGKTWVSKVRSCFSCREVEFVRLFPLGSSDEVLAAGIICQDPQIEEAIRFHFNAYAENMGMNVNWNYML